MRLSVAKFFLPMIFMLPITPVFGRGEAGTQVFYFPFAFQTDIGITRKTIESQALICIKINSSYMIESLEDLILYKDGITVEPYNIRLKLVCNGHIYFFDRLGNGVVDGKKTVIINREKFEGMISSQKINLTLRQ